MNRRQLRELWALGRLDLADPATRAYLRRALAGPVLLRTVATQLRTADVGLRDLTADGAAFRGVAAAYGVRYEIGGGRWEVIEPGSFRDSLAAQGGTVPVFWSHGKVADQPWTAAPIGVADATEQPDGLHAAFELFVTDSSEAKAVARAARAGALRGLSLGYTAEAVTYDRTPTGAPLERVTKGSLVEISFVVRGANPAAKLVKGSSTQ